MPKNQKGTRRERELLEFLSARGFVVHRVAGSGVGQTAICDLVAVKKGKTSFIECKSRKKVYYTKSNLQQLNELVTVAKKAGAKPILAVKLSYQNWKLIDISKKVPAKV